MVLGSDGYLYFSGSNLYGVNGNAAANSFPGGNILTFTKNTAMTNIVSMSLAQYGGIALDNAGKVYVWGANSFRRLGLASILAYVAPTELTAADLGLNVGETVAQVSLDDQHGAVFTTTGRVIAWGYAGFFGHYVAANITANGGSDRFLPTNITSKFSLGIGESIVNIHCNNEGTLVQTNKRTFVSGYNYNSRFGTGNASNSEDAFVQASTSLINPTIEFSKGYLGLREIFITTTTATNNKVFAAGNNGYNSIGTTAATGDNNIMKAVTF